MLLSFMGEVLTAIDLFSGCGGLSIGLKNAGFEVLMGLEINEEIAKTYASNHKKSVVLTKDIREVSGKDIYG